MNDFEKNKHFNALFNIILDKMLASLNAKYAYYLIQNEITKKFIAHSTNYLWQDAYAKKYKDKCHLMINAKKAFELNPKSSIILPYNTPRNLNSIF